MMSSRFTLIVFMVVSLLGAEAGLYITDSIACQKDMLTGWLIATLLHLGGYTLFHRSIGKSTDRFFLMALGGIILRLFLLIFSLVLVLVFGFVLALPFILGLLSAYFIGSFIEIWGLFTHPSGGNHT